MAEHYSEEVKDEAVQRYLNGEGAREIAKDMGMHFGSVLNWLHDRGHEPRPNGQEGSLPRGTEGRTLRAKVPVAIADRVDQFAKDNDVPKGHVIREALAAYLN